jgi:peptidoglycan/LPS O-acetylase OafA/YrhL
MYDYKHFIYRSIVFILYSLLVYSNLLENDVIYDNQVLPAVLGVMFIILLSLNPLVQKVFNYIGRYSLEIYLAHIIFASGIRIILDKFFHVDILILHIVLGLVFGLLAPLMLLKLSESFKPIKYLFKNVSS